MTYGLDTRAFIEHGPQAQSMLARETSSARSWRALTHDCRLALIERALQPPANDLIDAYPLAL